MSEIRTTNLHAGDHRVQRRRLCSLLTLPRASVACGSSMAASMPRSVLLSPQRPSPWSAVLHALVRLHNQRQRAVLRARTLLRLECILLAPATRLASQAMMRSSWVALLLLPSLTGLYSFRLLPAAASPPPRCRRLPWSLRPSLADAALPPPCRLQRSTPATRIRPPPMAAKRQKRDIAPMSSVSSLYAPAAARSPSPAAAAGCMAGLMAPWPSVPCAATKVQRRSSLAWSSAVSR